MQRKVIAVFKSSYFPYLSVGMGVLSVLIAWQSALWIENSEKNRFITASEQILFLAEKQLQSNVQLVCGAAAYVKASNSVSREDWNLFIQAQYLTNRFPSIQAVGYAPIVKVDHRKAYEASIQAEGFKDFAIFPHSQNSDAIVISYLEPFNAANQKAMGFDMASESRRKVTMQMAIERGVATLSPKIELVQGDTPEEKAGFVIYVPLYETRMVPDTQSQKNESIRGFIFAGIKAQTLFQGLLGKNYIKVDFEIYDGSALDINTKLFDSNPKLIEARYEQVKTISLYGKEWTFHFKTDEVLDISWSRYVPYMQAFFGIIFALVVGKWLYALQRTREEAYRIAEEKTKLLAHSEAEVRTIFQVMHEGVVVQNAQGVIIECNLAAQEIFGMSKEEMLGKTSSHGHWSAIREDGSLLPTQERPAPKALRTGKAQDNIIMGIKREDNEITWVQANAQPIFSDDFSYVESVVVTLSDITQFRKSKSKLEEYIALIDTNVIISSTNLEGIITEVSEAFCNISGYTKEELVGKNHNIVRHIDMPASLYEEMWKTLKNNQIWRGEMKNRHKEGKDYWVDATISPRYNELGEIIGYTAVRQDITDKKRIEELSITDRLTGLYNRLKLDELLSLQVNMAHRYETPFSAIMLDIDKFKSVNDTYGHQVGDTLLQEIATVLKTNVRQEDILGRWGGEEFLILLPSTALEGAVQLAEKLRVAIEVYDFTTVGKRTSSFGVATYAKGDDTKTVVGRADEALYRAKANGRNMVDSEIYTCELYPSTRS